MYGKKPGYTKNVKISPFRSVVALVLIHHKHWLLKDYRGPIRHNGAKKKLQLKHKNSLFTLQTFHYNYY
jgi:hypothetical protein